MAQSAKQAALETLDQIPDNADWDQIMYALYVREKIERGLKAVAEGRVLPQEDVRQRLLGRPED